VVEEMVIRVLLSKEETIEDTLIEQSNQPVMKA
jgi:hypothetical protein